MTGFDIDDLRALLPARDGKSSDERCIDFYAWNDGREMADAWQDDMDGVAEMLREWFRDGLVPASIADVETWLTDYLNPDGIGATVDELKELIVEYES